MKRWPYSSTAAAAAALTLSDGTSTMASLASSGIRFCMSAISNCCSPLFISILSLLGQAALAHAGARVQAACVQSLPWCCSGAHIRVFSMKVSFVSVLNLST